MIQTSYITKYRVEWRNISGSLIILLGSRLVIHLSLSLSPSLYVCVC